jgi:hypothetical protein
MLALPRLNEVVSRLAQSWHDRVLIRHTTREQAVAMATLAQKIEAEKRMRDLLEESGLPQPDYVEYGFTCIRLFFNDTKHIVVIDIDDPEGVEADTDTGPTSWPAPPPG